jgi:hypothetical protein
MEAQLGRQMERLNLLNLGHAQAYDLARMQTLYRQNEEVIRLLNGGSHLPHFTTRSDEPQKVPQPGPFRSPAANGFAPPGLTKAPQPRVVQPGPFSSRAPTAVAGGPAPAELARPAQAFDGYGLQEDYDWQQEEAAAKTRGGGRQKEKHLRETLRNDLEYLRTKDKRCVFVTRRINKLGFKSRQMLRNHFSQFGNVQQVLVAHSKLKSPQEAYNRTRPGNFGFVIMSNPQEVERVFESGTVQEIMGFEIQVHKFEHTQVEKEMREQAELAETGTKGPTSQQSKGARSDTLSDDASTLDTVSGWGRTTTAGSTSTDSAMQQQFWPRAISAGSGTSSGPHDASLDGSTTASVYRASSVSGLSNHSSGAEAKSATSPSPPRAPIPGVEALGLDSHRTAQNLETILGELGRIAASWTQPGQMGELVQEQAQAATLAQWAQQCLVGLEAADAGQRMNGAPQRVRSMPGALPQVGLPQVGLPSSKAPPGIAAMAHRLNSAPLASPAVPPFSGRSAEAEMMSGYPACTPEQAAANSYNPASQRGTLRAHLDQLSTVDEDCIVVARRINKLGFRSREILKIHFAQYGDVVRVLVAHSKGHLGKMHFRPGGLGLVVMRHKGSVQAILACEEHIVAGHSIQVQRFQRPTATSWPAVDDAEEMPNDEDNDKAADGGSSEPCEDTSGGSGPIPDKSSEGGSSEPYEQHERDPSSPGRSYPSS